MLIHSWPLQHKNIISSFEQGFWKIKWSNDISSIPVRLHCSVGEAFRVDIECLHPPTRICILLIDILQQKNEQYDNLQERKNNSVKGIVRKYLGEEVLIQVELIALHSCLTAIFLSETGSICTSLICTSFEFQQLISFLFRKLDII